MLNTLNDSVVYGESTKQHIREARSPADKKILMVVIVTSH